MKRYLKLASINLVLIGVFLLFTACMEQSLTVREDITTSLGSVMTYFEQNVIDKGNGTDFDTDTAQTYIKDTNYYVLVASKVTMDITQIKLGQVTYDGGQDYVLSVGNANVVTRVAYKVDEEQLYIAAPLLFLNAGNGETVTVSFPQQNIMPFTITVYGTGANKLKATVTTQTENVLFAVNQDGNEFNFKSDNPNNVIFVVLKNGQTVLPTTAKVLVEKVANPAKTNQTQAYSYSTPTMPTGQTQNGIEFFPGYNSGQAYTSTTPADHTLIYNLFVMGVGSVQLTLHFENTAQ